MMRTMMRLQLLSLLISSTALLSSRTAYGLSLSQEDKNLLSSSPLFSRRQAIGTACATLTAALTSSGSPAALALSQEESKEDPFYESFESRERKNNKNAVIREDYWYMMGKTPPRVLKTGLQGDNPQFNAFGACESTLSGDTGNPCTYVSLKQRIPAYSKYSFSIADGIREYEKLGAVLRRAESSSAVFDGVVPWDELSSFVVVQERTPPPPIIDAELKMVLFATAMLTSPNFPGPSRELLVARYYVNEVHYANSVISESILRTRDLNRAYAAWQYGRDSYNSYINIVNRSVAPKVGDKFDFIR